jgi:hypothetical protein
MRVLKTRTSLSGLNEKLWTPCRGHSGPHGRHSRGPGTSPARQQSGSVENRIADSYNAKIKLLPVDGRHLAIGPETVD